MSFAEPETLPMVQTRDPDVKAPIVKISSLQTYLQNGKYHQFRMIYVRYRITNTDPQSFFVTHTHLMISIAQYSCTSFKRKN